MPISIRVVLVWLASFAAFSGGTLIANADSYQDYRIKFCEKKKNNGDNWQKTHYAFATNPAGDHCGYSYGKDSINSAKFGATKACEKKAGETCTIVYAK